MGNAVSNSCLEQVDDWVEFICEGCKKNRQHDCDHGCQKSNRPCCREQEPAAPLDPKIQDATERRDINRVEVLSTVTEESPSQKSLAEQEVEEVEEVHSVGS